MAAIGTIDSKGTGHGKFPPRPAAEAESSFTVNGKPVLVDGNLFKPHSDGDSSHDGKAVTSRPWFTINGKGVVCVGDKISCGSTVADGDNGFSIA